MAIAKVPLKTVVQVTIEPDGSISDAWLSSYCNLVDGAAVLAETQDTIRLDKEAVRQALPEAAALVALKAREPADGK